MSSHAHQPAQFVDVFLQPGEFYFGGRETRIRTVLGSCVAITMWHPRLQVGGMCHYLLAESRGRGKEHGLDGRYAGDAISLFMRELEKNASRPVDYEVKLFGGGNQFPDHAGNSRINVSDNNVEVGRKLLKQHGFTLKAEHSGGIGPRNVIFDVWCGNVWLNHAAGSAEYCPQKPLA
ncbi:chemotaxis protein CheD [Methylomonas sp. LL1]|uniref:chemotaxis protein CheD n=1 Tax=Methylomonas sp. LL1 TaxID=2785785 RepID=UPI0018C3B262|nr:chemotaxis protein CheD [Methylomonas sp. LL1]QPK64594.1 chemotaxis protein CheD [Methylomonas sp. LL1]CAG1022256.1 Chemoreceptor glutamine deamidase CheD [Methylococcales bacterium]